MTPEWLRDLFAVAALLAGAFCAGCSWAAYRALGWVDRMHKWAASVEEASHSGVQR